MIIVPVVAERTGWSPLSTPTLYPTNDIIYQLETVGGSTERQTFPRMGFDMIKVDKITVDTGFPSWLRFSAAIHSDFVKIKNAYLIFRFANDYGKFTVLASYDSLKDLWSATWVTSNVRLPPWAEYDFAWCVDTSEAKGLCAPYQRARYEDSTQEWFRAENNYAVLYWYGDHESIAREFTRAVTMTYPRWRDGFGQDLSYKPIIVLYPDLNAISVKFRQPTDKTLMLVSAAHGVVSVVLPSNCTESDSLVTRILSGMTQLFAADSLNSPGGCVAEDGFKCVNGGPSVWMNGQAFWFANGVGDYDRQIRNWAANETIPRLTVSMDRLSTDECSHKDASRGASFVNWLVANYGIDTHRELVESMQYAEDGTPGMDFEDAIRQATGKSFVELEDDWRHYLELPE
jgi:hypothetical protein